MKPKGFKSLLVIAGVLLGIVVAFLIYDSTSSESNYRNILVEVDSAEVSRFVIQPKAKTDVIELVRKGDSWKVLSGNKSFQADKQFVASLIDQLEMLKPQRVVSTSKDKWKEYELDDSSSAKLSVYEGKNLVASIVIGKFNFKQGGNPYMNRGNSITSYVRLTGEDAIYAVDGMLSLSFMRGAEEYRDKTLASIKAEDISRISFKYPADSSFVLELKAGRWVVDGLPTDSAKVADYVGKYARLMAFDFVDESQVTNKTALFSVKVEGKSEQALEIFAYPADSSNVTIIESTANKGAYFSGSRSGTQGLVFVSKASLLK